MAHQVCTHFYALPKERLAGLLYRPAEVDVYGDLRIAFADGVRRGTIVLSDYCLPEFLGTGARRRRYVAIGTRAEVSARTRLELHTAQCLLDRVARRFEV